jgi:hypothetical protein
MESVSCAAPESELLPFLLAGTLSGSERKAIRAHGAVCPICAEELAKTRALVEGLRDAHLSSEEVVAAAWDGGPEGHLHDCSRCRAEVEDARAAAAALRAADRRRGARRGIP